MSFYPILRVLFDLFLIIVFGLDTLYQAIPMVEKMRYIFSKEYSINNKKGASISELLSIFVFKILIEYGRNKLSNLSNYWFKCFNVF